ncbi:hypothetical protein NE235_36185 [Actinoallomurus spadix]|uniref:Uncharacterized protein n=1 Tax=Actinoallomurus spadix TaxID=79912 RepID=A0ABP3GDF6_9ACTN|nr:DUF6544 family protein [Actinoallomurus spadix]MCO5991568.1 hypothetical protein [Actinoallomurus spadix]
MHDARHRPAFPVSPEHRRHFDPAITRSLPGPVRRWLCHAIRPGAPLFERVRLDMHGHIRIGRWRRFTAHQFDSASFC